jgi:transposase
MFLERKGLRVFIYREAIDMRCGFERLHSYCVHQMSAVMDQGHVYLFFGKNRRRLKILVYDGSGLMLIAKRIERGQFMSHAELLGRSEVTHEELKLILHGSHLLCPTEFNHHCEVWILRRERRELYKRRARKLLRR